VRETEDSEQNDGKDFNRPFHSLLPAISLELDPQSIVVGGGGNRKEFNVPGILSRFTA
jgi:hypothetical protein